MKVVIGLYRDNYTRGLQLSISQEEVDGSGEGYRIFGPKFLGDSELLHEHVLDERDAREIRRYLDLLLPTREAAVEIVADIIAQVREERAS